MDWEMTFSYHNMSSSKQHGRRTHRYYLLFFTISNFPTSDRAHVTSLFSILHSSSYKATSEVRKNVVNSVVFPTIANVNERNPPFLKFLKFLWNSDTCWLIFDFARGSHSQCLYDVYHTRLVIIVAHSLHKKSCRITDLSEALLRWSTKTSPADINRSVYPV